MKKNKQEPFGEGFKNWLVGDIDKVNPREYRKTHSTWIPFLIKGWKIIIISMIIIFIIQLLNVDEVVLSLLEKYILK